MNKQNLNPYTQYMYSYPHKTSYRTLQGVSLSDYLPRMKETTNSLYFHIPFCQYKCGYCNLFSVTGQSDDLMHAYVDTMERQAVQLSQMMPEGITFSDLTIGGGTPLLLPPDQLERIFELAQKYMNFDNTTRQIIIETSPNQTTPEKLSLLKQAHVNRISIGVQSFHNHELEALHRLHTAESARTAIDAIRRMDFDCLNIDLIYGIPGQTADSLLASLKEALRYEPEELFIYPLYVKPDTLLHQLDTVPNPQAYSMYRLVREVMKDAGYVAHSMRRFVKSDNRSIPYTSCGFDNTLSIGCGGRSYVGNLHFCTPYAVKQEHCLSILKQYISQKNFSQVTHGIFLTEDECKRRYVIKHILFGQGLNRTEYKQTYGKDVLADFPLLNGWIADGFAIEQEDFITLTESDFSLSDYLGPQLISDEIHRLCQDWRA